MKEYINNKIPHLFLSLTKKKFPLFNNEEEVLIYLKLLLDESYMYNSCLNYDAIDYEQLIYIEEIFGQNDKIKNYLSKIKKEITNNFILKQHYLNRIEINSNNIDEISRVSSVAQEIHLPPEWLNVFNKKEKEKF